MVPNDCALILQLADVPRCDLLHFCSTSIEGKAINRRGGGCNGPISGLRLYSQCEAVVLEICLGFARCKPTKTNL